MRSSTQRISSMFLALLLFVASAMVYSFFIQPTYRTILSMRSDLAEKSYTLEQQQLYRDRIKELQEKSAGVSALQSKLASILPASSYTSQGVHHLLGLAAVNRLAEPRISSRIVAIQPSKIPTLKGVGVVQYTIDTYGSYEGLKGFLAGIETNIRVMKVRSLKLARLDTKDTTQNNFRYTITLDAYYQSQ